MELFRKSCVACVFVAHTATAIPDTALAAEGASSNYFPGAYGSLLPGVAPEPGGVLADLNLYYNADASRAVLQGAANLSVEIAAYYNLIQGLYVWDAPAFGGRFAVGGYVPVGYASLGAAIGGFSVSGDEVGLGDIGIIPASFYWNSGNFHLNLYELVIAPTGEYSTSKAVNVGRNYWSFDTVAAATWFNPESGTEISVVPGIMFNTRNPATDYHTGMELHVDAMVNQFLSETFALGVHGYAYKQIEGDSGSGAILGSFKGESAGIGLALSWIPAFGGGKVAVSGKWLHDLTATNRLEADQGVLSIGVTF
jgi:hypothetical protein